MTKKTRRTATVAVQIHPVVTEGPLPLDSLNVRIVKRELHRWEHRIIEKDGDSPAPVTQQYHRRRALGSPGLTRGSRHTTNPSS
jgi:hypothetical protein